MSTARTSVTMASNLSNMPASKSTPSSSALADQEVPASEEQSAMAAKAKDRKNAGHPIAPALRYNESTPETLIDIPAAPLALKRLSVAEDCHTFGAGENVFVSREDLHTAVETLQLNLSEEEVQALFAHLGAVEGGRLSRYKWLATKESARTAEVLESRGVFPGDGAIGSVSDTIGALLNHNVLSPRGGYEAFDADSDGKISLSDFELAAATCNLTLRAGELKRGHERVATGSTHIELEALATGKTDNTEKVPQSCGIAPPPAAATATATAAEKEQAAQPPTTTKDWKRVGDLIASVLRYNGLTLEAGFEVFDHDQDGKISGADALEIGRHLQLAVSESEDAIIGFINHASTDGSGLVSKDEWVTVFGDARPERVLHSLGSQSTGVSSVAIAAKEAAATEEMSVSTPGLDAVALKIEARSRGVSERKEAELSRVESAVEKGSQQVEEVEEVEEAGAAAEGGGAQADKRTEVRLQARTHENSTPGEMREVRPEGKRETNIRKAGNKVPAAAGALDGTPQRLQSSATRPDTSKDGNLDAMGQVFPEGRGAAFRSGSLLPGGAGPVSDTLSRSGPAGPSPAPSRLPMEQAEMMMHPEGKELQLQRQIKSFDDDEVALQPEQQSATHAASDPADVRVDLLTMPVHACMDECNDGRSAASELGKKLAHVAGRPHDGGLMAGERRTDPCAVDSETPDMQMKIALHDSSMASKSGNALSPWTGEHGGVPVEAPAASSGSGSGCSIGVPVEAAAAPLLLLLLSNILGHIWPPERMLLGLRTCTFLRTNLIDLCTSIVLVQQTNAILVPDRISADLQRLPQHLRVTLRWKGNVEKHERMLVVALGSCKALAHLDLRESRIGALGVKILAGVLGECKALAHLDLFGNEIGDAGAGVLAGVLGECKALAHLALGHNRIGKAGAGLLAGVLGEFKALAHLDLSHSHMLSGNEIGPEGAGLLAVALGECKALAHLDLSGNEIGPEGAGRLAGLLGKCKALAYLDLRGNEIGDAGIGLMAEVLGECKALTYLDLGHNRIGYAGAGRLAGLLGECKALAYLNLFGNEIGDVGAGLLAGALGECKALAHLDLGQNKIGKAGEGCLRGALGEGRALDV